MSILDRLFGRNADTDSAENPRRGESAHNPGFTDAAHTNPFDNFVKHGSIDYENVHAYNYQAIRRNSRGVHRNSTIASGLVTRLEDTVINTGLTWESAPVWDLISDSGAPATDEDRYSWTQRAEMLWQLYHESTEPDITGRQTGGQLQRKTFNRDIVDGEHVAIIRYLNSPQRMSPVALQFIRPEQVSNPRDMRTIEAIDRAGGAVDNGIERNSTGQVVAIHVRESLENVQRIPIFGPRSGRRFVIHDGNFIDFGQWRGLPELSHVLYELHKLSEYDIAELEAAVSQAAWLGAIEAPDKDTRPGSKPNLKPNVSNKTGDDYDPKDGVEHTKVKKVSLFIQRLAPGHTVKWFAPTRPNQNFEKFVEAFMTRIASHFGMPLSVLQQKFQSSYSAARTELLTYWLNVQKRRANFVDGFLKPWHEAWFSESVRAGTLSAPGFDRSTTIRRAWLYGSWNGVAKPSVDPLKEVNAIEKRLGLGHTTGEREAKAYNGSDFRENAKKLSTENSLRAEAIAPMQPPEERGDIDPPDDGTDTEGNR